MPTYAKICPGGRPPRRRKIIGNHTYILQPYHSAANTACNGVKVEDFPLDKITSIQYETGLMSGKLKNPLFW